MNAKDRLCANIRAILQSKGIFYTESSWEEKKVFAYVYKSAFYDPKRHRLKCMAIVHDDALVIRHFDESRYVGNEEKFASLCLAMQNDLGYMSFDRKTKLMFYETSTVFDEFSFPSVRVFELLNEKASEYLFNRPLSLTDCTLPRLIEPRYQREFPPGVNSRAASKDPMSDLLSRSLESAADAKMKKMWIISSNREVDGVNVFTFTIIVRDMTHVPFLAGLFASVSLPVLLFYNQVPYIPCLEGRKFCVRVQTVTEGIRFKATEEPACVWVDMKNRRMKFDHSDDWAPFSLES